MRMDSGVLLRRFLLLRSFPKKEQSGELALYPASPTNRRANEWTSVEFQAKPLKHQQKGQSIDH